MSSRFAGDFSITWIPACAGMTRFCAKKLFGYMALHNFEGAILTNSPPVRAIC